MSLCLCGVCFSNDVMAGGAAQCQNGHLFCIECVVRAAAKDLGMTRDVKWSRLTEQALSWSRFKCCVCGLTAGLRRSTATDAGVAALPVKCGLTRTVPGVTPPGLQVCRWTGRRDQFDTHQHDFTDPTTQVAPWRGKGGGVAGRGPSSPPD